MNQQSPSDEMRETIARQAQEIESLHAQLAREQFAEELRQLLTSLDTTSILLSRFSHAQLLEMIIQATTRMISAQSSSLFLLDEDTKELVLEAAIGPKAQAVKQLRIPSGHGIAGMVALSGQPMAIACEQENKKVLIDSANFGDYLPECVLCVPLFYDQHIIGVWELLDKKEESSFSATDMQTLSLLANIAAVAIEQSRTYHDQKSVLIALIRSFKERDADHQRHLYESACAFADWLTRGHIASMKARELAHLVYELTLYGDNEYEMCLGILQSFATNLRNHHWQGHTLIMQGNAQRRDA